MAITNGTFDTDLSGWIFSSGISWKGGRAKIDQSACSTPSLEQMFAIDFKTLTFDYVSSGSPVTPTMPPAMYELEVNSTIVNTGGIPVVSGVSRSGTISIDTSPYLGMNGTLRFRMGPCFDCQPLCSGTVYIDNVLSTGGFPVFFNTSPQGATIIINGKQRIEVTPATLDILPGTYNYILRKQCFEDITGQFTLNIGGVVTIDRIFTLNTGSLSIRSTPSATVYIDGVLQSNPTPLNISCLPEKIYQFVFVLPNYQSYRGFRRIIRGLTSDINAILQLIGIPGTGSIAIMTNPSEASVTIDGILHIEKTPFTFNNIPPGGHAVLLQKTGYFDKTSNVTVDADVTSELNVILDPVSPSLRFFSNPTGAEIFINNISKGITSTSGLFVSSLTPGLLNFVAVLIGYERYNGIVNVVNNVITDVSIGLILATPGTGSVRFETNPTAASITIDGIDKGTTPNTVTKLPVGDHPYKLMLTGYTPEEGAVTILDKETITIFKTLKSAPGFGTTGLLIITGLAVGALLLLSRREERTVVIRS